MAFSPEPVDLVYILGAGHCGSTLLSLVLDRHPDLIGVSEIVGLNATTPGWAGEERYDQHHFWTKVAEEYRDRTGRSFWDVSFMPPPRVGSRFQPSRDWNIANALALTSILTVSGKRMVVDASKRPDRLRALLAVPEFQVRVLYLGTH